MATSTSVNDALDAAQNAVDKFQTMISDYQNVTQDIHAALIDGVAEEQRYTAVTADRPSLRLVDALLLWIGEQWSCFDQLSDDDNEEFPPPQPKQRNAVDEKEHDEKDTDEADEALIEDLGGFAAAKHDCPHVRSSVVIPKPMDDFAVKLKGSVECSFSDCHQTENWLCLQCHGVFCGRYGQKHMIQHYTESQQSSHCVAMGIGDLSFWCYKCDDYLHHLSIKRIFEMYKIVHQLKFGEPIPSKLEKETDFSDDDDDLGDNDAYASQSGYSNDPQQTNVARNPNLNPLTASGVNKGLGNVDSGKDTVLKEDQTEYCDSEQVLLKKAQKLAKLILASRDHGVVVHTGAGISTSANVPDYRGPNGIWTLKAKGQKIESTVDMDQVVPTYSHMALVKLMHKGLLQYVVSTNVDGLHRRSGISQQKLAELHGNIYMEYCNDCGRCYDRDYNVQNLQKNIATVATSFTRFTGRVCENEECVENNGGKLRDSIVAFGESLPQHELTKSAEMASGADLNIVIGSSMRVEPACSLPFKRSSDSDRNQYVCIINLQKTPYDQAATLRVWAECDTFMKMVMDVLKLDVGAVTSQKEN